MKQIFAPWRLAYISKSKSGSDGCVFCNLSSGTPGPENLVVARGEKVFVVLNRYPYVAGHLMVVPVRHINTPVELTLEEWTEMGAWIKASMTALGEVYGPQGFNVGMNVGGAAGAGIADHIHMHVVPRWNGDTNFVPVLSQTRVIPESLENTQAKLERALAGAGKREDW